MGLKDREQRRSSVVASMLSINTEQEEKAPVSQEQPQPEQAPAHAEVRPQAQVAAAAQPKLKQRAYYLREDQCTALKIAAATNSTDASAIVRNALDIYLHILNNQGREQEEIFKEAIGMFLETRGRE